jgi:bifunctional non-homologous end joining protein LigD
MAHASVAERLSNFPLQFHATAHSVRYVWRITILNRCGGLNPFTMWREYRNQAARLEALRGYRIILTASEHMRAEYLKYGFPAEAARRVHLPVVDYHRRARERHCYRRRDCGLDEGGKPSFNLLQGFASASAIVLYAFDPLMLCGKDVRRWRLDDRRDELRHAILRLPNTIRYSETFDVPLSDLVRTVRENQLEGIVAKRAGSEYRSGERSADWVKWHANKGQEFVIGGYTLNGNALDSILVGYYKGRDLMYAGSVRAGIPSEFPPVLAPHFEKLRTTRCPFADLPDRTEGRRGEGLTAAKMVLCRWLHPVVFARIEFLEWTPENRLRHPRFAGIRRDKDPKETVRE